MKVPEVRYARSGELNIAYQTVGEGPLDVGPAPSSDGRVKRKQLSAPTR